MFELPAFSGADRDRMRENVPEELLTLPNWVVADRTGKGKSSKKPINAKTGALAKSSDPST